MTRQIPLLLWALCPLLLPAQNHADCVSALEICNKQPLHFTVSGPGADPAELNSAICFYNGTPGNIESNTAWIRFTVAQSGSLWFVIRPDQLGDDLDFAVFRLDSGNCTVKTLVRCMAAGDISYPSPCMGPTGLLPGQTDVDENAGCTDPDDDNFLAALDLLSGETYILAINDFSSAQAGFSVEFCGTAMLGCESEVCAVLATAEKPGFEVVKIVPNPTVAGESSISFNMLRPETVHGVLYNALGQPVRSADWDLSEGQQRVQLGTEGLPAGPYFLTLSDGHSLRTQVLQIID